MAGVAWRVSLMPVRVADCRNGSNATAVANAIHYAVDAGARVIDLSAGSSRYTPAGCRPPAVLLADAVQYARDHGVLVVAPAGDEDKGCVRDPAAAPGVLAVGGFQTSDGGRWTTRRAGDASNWGGEIAVAAPADDILGPVRPAPGTQESGAYATSSGTAYSAAIVSGEAALLLSANPLLTPDWLIQLIERGASPRGDAGHPGWAGAGAVDLEASLGARAGGIQRRGHTGRASGARRYARRGVRRGCVLRPGGDLHRERPLRLCSLCARGGDAAGCGSPGAAVELRVNGVAVAEAAWASSATALDLDAGASPG